MTCDLFALCFEAKDPLRLARFWGGVLGWEMTDDRRDDGVALLPSDDTGFRIRFPASQDEKASQNRMHFDLTSTSLEDQQQTVARSLALGARHIDIGQLPDEGHVVLADPEGNEFCVIEPGNSFLADCGFIGALACDGSQEVGYFWSEAGRWSGTRTRTELVVIGIGQDHPVHATLADVDASRAQGDQPGDLRLLITVDRWSEVEVQPILPRLRRQWWAAPRDLWPAVGRSDRGLLTSGSETKSVARG